MPDTAARGATGVLTVVFEVVVPMALFYGYRLT